MLAAAGVTVRERFGDYDASPLLPGLAPHHPVRAGGMTLRFVPTPLEHPLEPPAPRAGGLDAAAGRRRSCRPSTRDAQLQRLRQPGALAVTTGQQPGLFTGPLYTVHKALSAAALARVLEARWNRPVVPVFWLAGDDHDFAEASTASWIAADGAARHRLPAAEAARCAAHADVPAAAG